jgi:hypothetical protein
VTIDEIVVADPTSAWEAAGFAVDADAICRIGTVRIRLVGRGQGIGGGLGIVGWSLRDLPGAFVAGEVDGDLDGIPTTASDFDAAPGAEHANGVTHIDHVVLMSPDLERTVAAMDAIGLYPRRERDAEVNQIAMRQIFFRLGQVILEVVGAPDVHVAEPSVLWGLTHAVTDLDATAALLGEGVGRIKDAVQPGRRIATLRHRDLGMSVRTAFITS